MSASFDFEVPPFDTLNAAQQALLRATAGLVHFAAGDPVLTPQMEATHAYLLVQGHVRREAGLLPEASWGPGTLFGARAVLAARASSSSLALDEVTAWQIPKATLQSLLSANPAFCAAVFGEVARRLSQQEARGEQREFLSLMMARVRDAYVRKPFYVDGALDLVGVCALMHEAGQSNALVRDGERIGMFTTTDLRDALLRRGPGGGILPPGAVAVREVARFDLVSVSADGELFEALLLMLRHRVHRVLVRDGAGIAGVLSQLDLMSFVSNHSHLIALQVEQAEDIAELKAAALQLDGLVALLHGGGVKVEVIAGMVRVLNAQVFERLWSFVAPPELIANSCLLVMGSEGRGEQILKTDQDNALLLRDGFEYPGLPQVAAAFNQALIEFGWPPCPGDIMLTNPLWCAPLAAFRERIRGWIYGGDNEGPMRLAIFMDAHAVAGDAALLQQARQFMHDILPDHQAFLARFAGAVEQFQEPAGWWARLTGQRGRDDAPFDLKKLGIFPIVHGVRSLALQAHVTSLSTAERLRALADAQQLEAGLARDLLEALHFLMGLRLKNHLAQRQLGRPADNLVRLSALSTLERDRLQDTLGIVKRLRQHLQQHFRLAAL
ncbi:MAG TPA: putative nucleotidyltransferase substrate binding domain-containing protein [Rubrivivax sp.]|nr:putative nucleotidyltransferase substrate binding domain-containing protein [Rubrivivax sp.]